MALTCLKSFTSYLSGPFKLPISIRVVWLTTSSLSPVVVIINEPLKTIMYVCLWMSISMKRWRTSSCWIIYITYVSYYSSVFGMVTSMIRRTKFTMIRFVERQALHGERVVHIRAIYTHHSSEVCILDRRLSRRWRMRNCWGTQSSRDLGPSCYWPADFRHSSINTTNRLQASESSTWNSWSRACDWCWQRSRQWWRRWSTYCFLGWRCWCWYRWH